MEAGRRHAKVASQPTFLKGRKMDGRMDRDVSLGKRRTGRGEVKKTPPTKKKKKKKKRRHSKILLSALSRSFRIHKTRLELVQRALEKNV